MSSQSQFEYYKYLFERESSRYQELINRGKLFLSVITLYLGLLAVAADKSIPKLQAYTLPAITYFIGVALIVTALTLVVLAVGIYQHEKPSDPMKMIDRYSETEPTDSEFFDERIADFAVATERNARINDRRAALLRFASFVLLFGVAAQTFLLASLFIVPTKGG